MTEDDIQMLIFEWASIHIGKHPELTLMHHVPNGGHRHIATATKLKRMGVKSGVPDIVLPVSRKGFHGLYIELKKEKGKVSDHQMEWLHKLNEQGYMAVVAFGFDQAIQIIKNYIKEDDKSGRKR